IVLHRNSLYKYSTSWERILFYLLMNAPLTLQHFSTPKMPWIGLIGGRNGAWTIIFSTSKPTNTSMESSKVEHIRSCAINRQPISIHWILMVTALEVFL